jgi:hypothetical protein
MIEVINPIKDLSLNPHTAGRCFCFNGSIFRDSHVWSTKCGQTCMAFVLWSQVFEIYMYSIEP